MKDSYQNSNISQILEAIINESSFMGSCSSEIGDILLSILNTEPYDKEPTCVIGDLLLKVKAKIAGESFDPYEGSSIGRISDILLSILDESEYNEEPRSKIAELFLELKAKIEDNPEGTASGKIASFTTTLEDGAIKTVEIDLDPALEHTSEYYLYAGGATLVDCASFELGAIDDQTGEFITSNEQLRYGLSTGIVGGLDYFIKVGSNKNVSIYWYSIYEYIGVTENVKNEVITAPENAAGYAIVTSPEYGTTNLNDIYLNYPASNTDNNEYVPFMEYFIDFYLWDQVQPGGKIEIDSEGGIFYTDLGGNKQRIGELSDPFITINGVNNFWAINGNNEPCPNVTVNYLKS